MDFSAEKFGQVRPKKAKIKPNQNITQDRKKGSSIDYVIFIKTMPWRVTSTIIQLSDVKTRITHAQNTLP